MRGQVNSKSRDKNLEKPLRSPDTITFGKIMRFIDGSSLEYLVSAEIHTPGATIVPMKRPA